jgi:hypothetical protein
VGEEQVQQREFYEAFNRQCNVKHQVCGNCDANRYMQYPLLNYRPREIPDSREQSNGIGLGIRQ